MLSKYLVNKPLLESMGDITPAEWKDMTDRGLTIDSKPTDTTETDAPTDAPAPDNDDDTNDDDVIENVEECCNSCDAMLSNDDFSSNPILESMCNISYDIDTCFILTENSVLSIQGKMLEVKAILESIDSSASDISNAKTEGKDTFLNGAKNHLLALINRIKEMIKNVGMYMNKVMSEISYFFADTEKWANTVTTQIPDYCKGYVYSGYRWDINAIKVEDISKSVFKTIEAILPYKTKDGMADAVASYKSNEWSPANIKSKFMKDAHMDHSKDLSTYINFTLRGKMAEPISITSFSVIKPKDMIGIVRTAKVGLLSVTKAASTKLTTQLESELDAWETNKDNTPEEIEYISASILLLHQAIGFVNTVTLLKVNAIKEMSKEYMRAINGLTHYKPEVQQ